MYFDQQKHACACVCMVENDQNTCHLQVVSHGTIAYMNSCFGPHFDHLDQYSDHHFKTGNYLDALTI